MTEAQEPEKPKRTGREGVKTSFIDWFRSSKKEEKRVREGGGTQVVVVQFKMRVDFFVCVIVDF